MVEKKKYSAGLVSQRFWFYEIKQYIELLNDGKTHDEIQQMSESANIFGAVSTSRSREVLRGTKRRVDALGDDMLPIFPQLNIDNQKIVALIAVLILNDLFFEFMQEVYRPKLVKGDLQLSTIDFKSFFSEKQRSNEIVAGWKPYTYNRLGSVFRNYLIESGVAREKDSNLAITPKVLDPKIIHWLKSIDRMDIVIALTGGM